VDARSYRDIRRSKPIWRNRPMGVWFMLVLTGVFAAQDTDEYQFVKNTDMYVAIIRGEAMSIGKLDAAGNFDPDPHFHNIKGGLSSSPPFRVMNELNPKKERVYEFRSERLILGELDEKGNFVPDVGSKVIEFKNYLYKKGAVRIYNLPGYYLKKGEKKRE
jgi:hypothetical protein